MTNRVAVDAVRSIQAVGRAAEEAFAQHRDGGPVDSTMATQLISRARKVDAELAQSFQQLDRALAEPVLSLADVRGLQKSWEQLEYTAKTWTVAYGAIRNKADGRQFADSYDVLVHDERQTSRVWPDAARDFHAFCDGLSRRVEKLEPTWAREPAGQNPGRLVEQQAIVWPEPVSTLPAVVDAYVAPRAALVPLGLPRLGRASSHAMFDRIKEHLDIEVVVRHSAQFEAWASAARAYAQSVTQNAAGGAATSPADIQALRRSERDFRESLICSLRETLCEGAPQPALPLVDARHEAQARRLARELRATLGALTVSFASAIEDSRPKPGIVAFLVAHRPSHRGLAEAPVVFETICAEALFEPWKIIEELGAERTLAIEAEAQAKKIETAIAETRAVTESVIATLRSKVVRERTISIPEARTVSDSMHQLNQTHGLDFDLVQLDHFATPNALTSSRGPARLQAALVAMTTQRDAIVAGLQESMQRARDLVAQYENGLAGLKSTALRLALDATDALPIDIGDLARLQERGLVANEPLVLVGDQWALGLSRLADDDQRLTALDALLASQPDQPLSAALRLALLKTFATDPNRLRALALLTQPSGIASDAIPPLLTVFGHDSCRLDALELLSRNQRPLGDKTLVEVLATFNGPITGALELATPGRTAFDAELIATILEQTGNRARVHALMWFWTSPRTAEITAENVARFMSLLAEDYERLELLTTLSSAMPNAAIAADLLPVIASVDWRDRFDCLRILLNWQPTMELSSNVIERIVEMFPTGETRRFARHLLMTFKPSERLDLDRHRGVFREDTIAHAFIASLKSQSSSAQA